jgi:hypothetical protein
LFTIAGKNAGASNLTQGSVLPSDQSHVTLALRVFVWYKKPEVRSAAPIAPTSTAGEIGNVLGFQAISAEAIARVQDAYRLYWQSLEQLHWSYGTGQKFSIENMATKYFPDGGGLHGDMGGVSDLIHWNNGMPSHAAILRLARAILLPPRQNVRCQADIISLNDAGANAAAAGITTPTGRDMLNLRDNLNALDGMGKVIQFTFDGLFARDVQ